jgi:DNA-binding transcriptional ArsR family regulator
MTAMAGYFEITRNVLTRVAADVISINIERIRMEASQAVTALASLAQEHRLALFRLLVQAGGDGMPAGAVAEALRVPNSSLSFHLAQLHRAGLIRQERRGRSLVYSADYGAMNALIGYLMENCCAGAACAPEAACAEPTSPVTQRRKA